MNIEININHMLFRIDSSKPAVISGWLEEMCEKIVKVWHPSTYIQLRVYSDDSEQINFTGSNNGSEDWFKLAKLITELAKNMQKKEKGR